MANGNYIDILLSIPLLWFAYKGFTKGLVLQVCSLVALIVGIWVAIKFSGLVYIFLNQYIDWQYLQMVAFAVTFLGVLIAINLLGRMLTKILNFVALGTVNKLLGALLGIAKMSLILSVIILLIGPLKILSTEDTSSSILFLPLSELGEQCARLFHLYVPGITTYF